MPYLGVAPNPRQNREVDDISSGFNGGTTQFTLQSGGSNVSPGSDTAIVVSLGGVVQNPGTDYTIAASTITFTTAPASGLSFFGVVLAQSIDIETPADGTVTTAKIVDGAVTNAKVNASAAIAGTKISPDFGSQAISTTGGLSINGATVFNELGADVDFRVESDTNTHAIFLNAGNSKVGINNSSPNDELSVAGNVEISSGASNLKISSSNPSVKFTDTDASGGFGLIGVNNTSGSLVMRSDDGNALSGTFMGFEVDGSEKMRIKSNDLLIGKTVNTTSTSGVRIATEGSLSAAQGSTSTNFGTAGGANIALCNNNATDNNFTSIGGYKSDGLVTSQINFVNVNHSSRHGALAFMTHNGSALTQRMLINKDGKIELGASGPASRIDPTENGVLYIEADPGSNYGSSSIRFFVDNGEIMRINRGSNPFVAIGRTNQQGNEGFTVDRNGQDVCFFTQNSSGTLVTLKLLNKRATSSTEGEQISFLDESGNQRGKIINNTSTTTYVTSSDYRLKENQVEISDGIDRVKQLKPYKFNWKNRPGIIVDGFFAHEVENLVKDCVNGEKDRVVTQDDHDKGDYLDKNIGEPLYQMIDNSQIVPLLTAALKEAIAEIEILKTKVAALETA